MVNLKHISLLILILIFNGCLFNVESTPSIRESVNNTVHHDYPLITSWLVKNSIDTNQWSGTISIVNSNDNWVKNVTYILSLRDKNLDTLIDVTDLNELIAPWFFSIAHNNFKNLPQGFDSLKLVYSISDNIICSPNPSDSAFLAIRNPNWKNTQRCQ